MGGSTPSRRGSLGLGSNGISNTHQSGTALGSGVVRIPTTTSLPATIDGLDGLSISAAPGTYVRRSGFSFIYASIFS